MEANEARIRGLRNPIERQQHGYDDRFARPTSNGLDARVDRSSGQTSPVRIPRTRDSQRFELCVVAAMPRADLRSVSLRVGSIVIRVDDLERQAAFWEAALGYIRRPDDSDDFILLRPKDGNGPNVSLDAHHSTLAIPPRIHVDLYAEDQAAEVSRLVGLGATEVRWDRRPPDADYVILADPEGNRFCVIDVPRQD